MGQKQHLKHKAKEQEDGEAEKEKVLIFEEINKKLVFFFSHHPL